VNLIDLAGVDLLRRVFSFSPSTEKIDLFDISLKRDAKTLIANFDLVDQLPDRPLKEWKSFNRCRMGIYCAAVDDLKISGWGSKNISILSIGEVKENYEVRIIGESLDIRFICRFISLVGPSVYLDEE
jgi:hypothetical protein